MILRVDSEQPHLGGYVPGGDPRTWCPTVWRVLCPPKGGSVIDVGCGEGQALRWFQEAGCEVLGIEGMKQWDPNIIQHDYTLGPYDPVIDFDLCWSCEFLEHVEEQFIPNFMATFKRAKRVAVTAAPPGQDGHHHVNCQPQEYWIKVFEEQGFTYNAQLTMETRAPLRSVNNFWGKNGMIYERN